MAENSINTKIANQNNYQVKDTIVSNPVQTFAGISNNLNGKISLRDEFVKEKKKTGLFERFYDFCKNTTGIGLGSKKIEKAIADCETGKLEEEKVRNQISEYKVSRENAEQNFGDLAAGATTISGFFLLNNLLKKTKEIYNLSGLAGLDDAIKETSGIWKTIFTSAKKVVTTNAKFAVIVPVLMATGAFTKWATLKVNRFGSKEYKVDNEKQLSKEELKKAKKELNWARHKQNFKNFFTGAVDGLLAPATALVGGIVGVPAYLLATMGLRSATSKNDGGFVQTLKDNALLSGLFTAAIAIPAFKKAHFSSILSKNLKTVAEKLKKAELIKPDLPSARGSLNELSEKLFNSTKINQILNHKTMSIDEKIIALIDENLFAAKFLQVSNRKMLPGKLEEIAEQLVEKCPPTRTLEEAKTEIARLLGDSESYTISKRLGTGTVAETYLAKDKSGKEVCIKILKKGIDAEKVLKDKESFIQIITNGAPKGKWTKEQQYLVRNIDNMAEGLLNEVDLVHEKEAAIKLVPYTKVCNVVKPIMAKKGIYIMEKAEGISLKTLIDYYSMKRLIKSGALRNPEKAMEELKAHAPAFNDIDLNAKDIKYLLNKYTDVMIEQLNKMEKSGKTLHADIHPGNIFIDLNALKSKKGKLYTLIDTGNTVDLTKEQAQRVLKLTAYVKRGNVKELTDYLLDGAILPEGLTKEKANELINARLKKLFYGFENNKTEKISKMDIDSFKSLSNAIYKEYGIIPNDAHLTLEKAKSSADESLAKLTDSFMNDELDKFVNGLDKNTSKVKVGTKAAGYLGRVGLMAIKNPLKKGFQETKNLVHLSPKEIVNYFNNPNNLKTNSEEYLTYQFKQFMNTAAEKETFNVVD